jgi:hypothetical protein
LHFADVPDSQNVWKFFLIENSDYYPNMTQLSLE